MLFPNPCRQSKSLVWCEGQPVEQSGKRRIERRTKAGEKKEEASRE